MKPPALALLWLLWLMLAWGPAAAEQQPWAPQLTLYVLTDPRGVETIESISAPARAADFQPVQGSFAGGFGRKVYWFRVEWAQPQASQQRLPLLLLEARPTYLDDLRFYLPHAQQSGRFIEHRHGDRLPFDQRAIATRTFVQPVPILPEAAQTVYIRLQTTSSAALSLRVWSPVGFHDAAVAEYALLGFLVGAFALALLGQIPAAVRGQDAWSRPFLAYTVAAAMIVVFVQGLGAQFLFPLHPLWADHLAPVSSTLLCLTAAAFYRRALRIADWSIWVDRWFIAVIAFAVFSLPAPVWGYYERVALFIFLALLSVLVLAGVRCLQLLLKRTPDSRGLFLSIMATLAGAVPTVMALLGWLSAEYLVAYAYLAGILGSVLIVQWVLLQRAHRAQQVALVSQRAQARAEALAGEQQAVAEQQRRFVDMLTHEIKSPLSVVRMRLGSPNASPPMQQHALQAVQDIDGLVERIGLASRLEHGIPAMQLQPLPLAAFVRECMAAFPAAGSRFAAAAGLCDQAAASAVADPFWLRVACQNLLDNALKYAPPDAPVHIRLCAQTSPVGVAGWAIRIANAPGAAGKPDPAKVGTKYHRGAAAHSSIGTGLGLYIVAELAQAMGGRLSYLADEPEVVFELWLPHEHPAG